MQKAWAGISLLVLVPFLFLFPSRCLADHPILSLAEIRHEGVILQNWDTSCGAAALATLLTYTLADPVTEREVAQAMLHSAGMSRVRARGGFSLLDMQQYAEKRGYQAEGYGEMTFADLPALLPAIVPVQFHGYDHFVVVREIRNGTVYFADPAYGRRAAAIEEFTQAWKSRIAFIVSKP